MNKIFTLISTLALLLVVFPFMKPADAQLVVVEEDFRIVSVDENDNRFAIAKPDADPDVRQNWVYLEHDARLARRHYLGNGAFRDEVIRDDEAIFNILRANRGKVIKVHGGRDWDGSIDASKLWM